MGIRNVTNLDATKDCVSAPALKVGDTIMFRGEPAIVISRKACVHEVVALPLVKGGTPSEISWVAKYQLIDVDISWKLSEVQSK